MSDLTLKFSSLSLGAAVDNQTGNLSVFEVVEEIRSPQVPFQMGQLCICTIFEKKQDVQIDAKVFIHVIPPDGQQQKVGSGDVKIPKEKRKMKAVFRLGGFPVSSFGVHKFVVSWTDNQQKKVGEAILEFDAVQFTQVAQGVPPQDPPAHTH